MLHQDSRIEAYPRDFVRAPTERLSMIAYRSRAVEAPTDAALQRLLQASQERNKASGLTGVLLYERGCYFQWLEGPNDSLQRVWNSIVRDPRHDQVNVLRKEPIRDRVFEDWDLRIALGGKVSIDATVTAMESSTTQLRQVIGRPTSSLQMSLEDTFAAIVIPRLLGVHGRDARTVRPFASTASIWHADADSGDKLASILIAARSMETNSYVDSLLDQGANFNALYKEVFEPAQLQLGRLWDEDLCDDFHLAIAMSRLQMEIWRVNAALPAEHRGTSMHSALLAAQLNEPHRLGLLMSCEVFERGGWDVICQPPGGDEALNDVLRTQWFDVLKLSQSNALRRDSRLESIRETIDGARAASLNPTLIVMVDGRTFAEQPQIYRAIHANAMCISALDAVPEAERLLEISCSQTPLCLQTPA